MSLVLTLVDKWKRSVFRTEPQVLFWQPYWCGLDVKFLNVSWLDPLFQPHILLPFNVVIQLEKAFVFYSKQLGMHCSYAECEVVTTPGRRTVEIQHLHTQKSMPILLLDHVVSRDPFLYVLILPGDFVTFSAWNAFMFSPEIKNF